MDDDWDLFAVVRGASALKACNSAAAPTTIPPPTTTLPSTITTSSNLPLTTNPTAEGFSLTRFQEKNDHFLYYPDLQLPKIGSTTTTDGLHDLLKPFCPKTQPISQQQNIPISPLSVLGGLPVLSQPQQERQNQNQNQNQNQLLLRSNTTFVTTAPATTRQNSLSQNPKPKKRKNQMKRVCQVPAEGLSSDMWSWRKYGQKPIKGSPFPRGYYRCSTSKGCSARKQVERNRSDPNMFVITYTGEHNHPIPTHRNSLAGSTRQKAGNSETVAEGETNKPISSPPVSPAGSSPAAAENMEVEDEDDEFAGSDTPLSDDFFTGFDEMASPATEDGFSDRFQAFPWGGNNVTTTAAGGV